MSRIDFILVEDKSSGALDALVSPAGIYNLGRDTFTLISLGDPRTGMGVVVYGLLTLSFLSIAWDLVNNEVYAGLLGGGLGGLTIYFAGNRIDPLVTVIVELLVVIVVTATKKDDFDEALATSIVVFVFATLAIAEPLFE